MVLAPRARTARSLLAVALVLAVAAGCAAGSGTAGDQTDGGTLPPGVTTTTSQPSATATTATPSTVATTTTAPTTTAPTTTSSTTTSTTTTSTVPLPPGTPPGLVKEVGDLDSGSKGLRTLALQQALKALKYDPGAPDGAFGLKTKMAIWAYQALHGLPTDGHVNLLLEASILTAKPAAMLRPDLGPTHTEVDLDKQVLLVFRDDALQLVTHVSSGSGRHYCDKGNCGTAVTPLGDYRYQRRISGWRVAPLGRLYNPVYFNGGIAVHGAPSVPNSPASHGCVRIPMHVAEYFPSLVVNGEPISVFRGGPGGAEPATVAPPAPGTTQPATTDVLAGD